VAKPGLERRKDSVFIMDFFGTMEEDATKKTINLFKVGG